MSLRLHRIPVLFASVLFALPGCAVDQPTESTAVADSSATTGAVAPASASGAGALGVKKFGAAISEPNETALADIVRAPGELADKTVLTSGKVQAVCQMAGCWMEIGDDTTRAHIKMAGHSFYIPRDASGHNARVQGTVKSGPPKDECGDKDSCSGEANGAVAKVEIEATGVELLD